MKTGMPVLDGDFFADALYRLRVRRKSRIFSRSRIRDSRGTTDVPIDVVQYPTSNETFYPIPEEEVRDGTYDEKGFSLRPSLVYLATRYELDLVSPALQQVRVHGGKSAGLYSYFS